MLTIEISLPRLFDANVTAALEPAVNMALDLLLERVTTYPPPRPGSTYVRGGPRSENLGHQWTQRVTVGSDYVEGVIGNKVSYGPYVQDEYMQAWMHRGRWTPIQEIAEQELDRIEAIFLRVLETL